MTLAFIEEWRPVLGAEDSYEVSDLGRVRSVDRYVRCGWRGAGRRLVLGRILRPGRMVSGHLSVAIGKNNSRTVHSLVMQAFVGPPPEGLEVRHLDGVPSNNVRSNLKYGTRSENIEDDYRHGVRKHGKRGGSQ